MRYGCCPLPYGHGPVADVPGRRRHREPGVRECVLDRERQRERVARLRLEEVLHDDPVRRHVDNAPGRLADEPVDRVSVLRLRERQLHRLAVELVASVLDPVRPGGEHLPTPGARALAGRKPVEQCPSRDFVRAEPAAEGDDALALLAARELDLSSRLGDRGPPFAHALTAAATVASAPRRSSRWSPTRSEFAIAVSAGLTAPMLGKTLVSTT